MIFTVVWESRAEQRLTSIWLDSRYRHIITQAAAAIDQILRENPADQGESRDRLTRILIIAPLGVLFEVSQSDRIVHVFDVWMFE